MKRRRRANVRRWGGAYVEIVISSLVVSVLLVASLQAVAQSTLAQRLTSERATGMLLADALLREICDQPYADTNSSPVSFGPEQGETARGLFDDVDDYHLFEDAPPNDRQGNVLGGLANWQRRVRVEWVASSNHSNVSVTETGVKRIIVEALCEGRLAATVYGLRGNAP